MDHDDENIQMVCAFINRGRNNINIDNFIKIFDEKFPNRCRDIEVIYPDDYEYIEKSCYFVKKEYAESNLWQGIPMTNKQLFENRLKRVILHQVKIIKVKEWCHKNKRLPNYKNGKDELYIYRILSSLKNYNYIYKDLLSEFLEDTRTQKEKNNDEWYEMYNKLLLHIENNKQLPKNTCEDEKLWYWIGTQKQKFKNRKLSQEYIDKLEEISIWWWTEIHQGYLSNKQWFLDNHKLIPKKDKHGTVYRYYTKIKNYYLLPEEDIKCLTNYERELISTIPIIQEWINYKCPVKKTDENYKEFYKKH